MSSKINIHTFQQSIFLDEELDRFRQYITEKSEKYQLLFSANQREFDFSLLQSGDVDLIVVPLEQVPLSLPDNTSIAALSPRKEVKEAIFMSNDASDDDMDFRLRKGAQITVSNERQQYQLLQLRPDLKISEDTANADAYFGIFENVIPHGKQAVYLNPKEFLPAAGFGVFAWITLTEHVELRKLLKDFHHKDTSVLTNMERKLIKLNDNPNLKIIGVYAYKSRDEHYHLFANGINDGNMISHRISQTTTANICENMLQLMNTAITN